MSTRPYATTNARLADAIEIVDELITWAISDAEHASENDAPETAKDDRFRAKRLQQVRNILTSCERE
jgi:hypothetical protein